MRWEHQKPQKPGKGKEIAGRDGLYAITWTGGGPPRIPPPPVNPWSGRKDGDDDGEDDGKSSSHFSLSGLTAIAGTTTLSSDFDEDEFQVRREPEPVRWLSDVLDIYRCYWCYWCQLAEYR